MVNKDVWNIFILYMFNLMCYCVGDWIYCFIYNKYVSNCNFLFLIYGLKFND